MTFVTVGSQIGFVFREYHDPGDVLEKKVSELHHSLIISVLMFSIIHDHAIMATWLLSSKNTNLHKLTNLQALAFCELLRSKSHTVFHVGAGISTSAQIPGLLPALHPHPCCQTDGTQHPIFVGQLLIPITANLYLCYYRTD